MNNNNSSDIRSFKIDQSLRNSYEADKKRIFDQYQINNSYNFITGIVKEVISNPYEFLNFKINEKLTVKDFYLTNYSDSDKNIDNKSIVNPEVLDSIPMNSLFCHIVDDNISRSNDNFVICYPFFPPHLSLPIKPGEYVWLVKETIKGNNHYYWFCRKVSNLYVDDINYTNFERIPIVNEIKKEYEKNNGGYDISKEQLLLANNLNNDVKTNLFYPMSSLMKESYSYKKEFTGEPVPRLSKDCGDFLIQGSNNAGIHLTTEKFLTNTNDNKIFTNANINKDTLDNRIPQSPAIDLFVGRKKESLNKIKNLKNVDFLTQDKLNIVKNTSSDHRLEYFEIDKTADILLKNNFAHSKEINDDINDALDVGARLYMSQNTKIDEIFKTNFDNLPSLSGPSILSFSDNNRMIANNNNRIVSLLGQSFIDLDAEGNITIKATKGGAYISLKSDGSISIVPGENGLIYLGGDKGEALNTPLIQTAIPAIGTVSGIPIVSTMGGVVGIDGPNTSGVTGKFASKLLIK